MVKFRIENASEVILCRFYTEMFDPRTEVQ